MYSTVVEFLNFHACAHAVCRCIFARTEYRCYGPNVLSYGFETCRRREPRAGRGESRNPCRHHQSPPQPPPPTLTIMLSPALALSLLTCATAQTLLTAVVHSQPVCDTLRVKCHRPVILLSPSLSLSSSLSSSSLLFFTTTPS